MHENSVNKVLQRDGSKESWKLARGLKEGCLSLPTFHNINQEVIRLVKYSGEKVYGYRERMKVGEMECFFGVEEVGESVYGIKECVTDVCLLVGHTIIDNKKKLNKNNI